ncbi:hypothetical protein Anapl_09692 [Anas platyrhynchos]|uniref:Uncharacterized protein n=1 Tax=Anas platyrhynchos TaxID=8839 RepID=R0LNQ6_ANAPL|nr:hypothetical protein Anapl_09692 [Anas platyrhynchos]
MPVPIPGLGLLLWVTSAFLTAISMGYCGLDVSSLGCHECAPRVLPVAAQDNFKSLELAKGKAAAPAPSPALQTQKPVYIGGEKQDLQLVLITLWLKMVQVSFQSYCSLLNSLVNVHSEAEVLSGGEKALTVQSCQEFVAAGFPQGGPVSLCPLPRGPLQNGDAMYCNARPRRGLLLVLDGSHRDKAMESIMSMSWTSYDPSAYSLQFFTSVQVSRQFSAALYVQWYPVQGLVGETCFFRDVKLDSSFTCIQKDNSEAKRVLSAKSQCPGRLQIRAVWVEFIHLVTAAISQINRSSGPLLRSAKCNGNLHIDFKDQLLYHLLAVSDVGNDLGGGVLKSSEAISILLREGLGFAALPSLQLVTKSTLCQLPMLGFLDVSVPGAGCRFSLMKGIKGRFPVSLEWEHELMDVWGKAVILQQMSFTCTWLSPAALAQQKQDSRPACITCRSAGARQNPPAAVSILEEQEMHQRSCIDFRITDIEKLDDVPRELSAGGVLDYQIYRVENHWLYPHFANTILVLSMQHSVGTMRLKKKSSESYMTLWRLRENVLWEELHRHREEASEKVSGMREKCFKKDIQDPAAPRAARVLLRRTGPGDADGPEILQGVQRDGAKFATLQKIMELAETIVCLQDTPSDLKAVTLPRLKAVINLLSNHSWYFSCIGASYCYFSRDDIKLVLPPSRTYELVCPRSKLKHAADLKRKSVEC